MTTSVDSQKLFNNLGIAPRLLEILAQNKFIHPTPIQEQSIPIAVEGKDLMGIAQTGTGKTLAFGVPMIQRLAQSKGAMKGLVILPTRELALQVDETLRKIGATLGLKTAILIGGEAMARQLRQLRQKPHIIVATPGRLIDHLENKTVELSKVGILVLDEADRMLDMGFEPQIKKILQRVPVDRQTMLFSATMPNEIVKIANSYLSLPLRVEVAPPGSAVNTVTQEVFFVDRGQKLGLLRTVLSEYKGSVLIFCRTKHGARKVTSSIRAMGHTAAEIHSNRSLNQRIEALEGFKIGRYRVLVATDIAARGIDVTGIELVINYDLPATADDYIHRIGRTARAGRAGHAISFAQPDQQREIRNIERLIRKPLKVSKAQVSHMPQTKFTEQKRPFSNFRKPGTSLSVPGKPIYRRKPRSGFRRRPEHGFRGSAKPSGYFLKRY
ncbi:MAG: DEAD/DEAH box helicase [Candidatus Doudnabacteria bacterium]|nr:DEAD/DEAH box helicase [Candidatus Doudnabacteria bacterium]